jgi:GTPase SAR1 family protein
VHSRLASDSFVSVSFYRTPGDETSERTTDSPQSSPTLAPDYKGVTVRVDDTVVNVELWDFPGFVAGETAGPLLSTFVHAAIICFSLEEKEKLASLAETVSQAWQLVEWNVD